MFSNSCYTYKHYKTACSCYYCLMLLLLYAICSSREMLQFFPFDSASLQLLLFTRYHGLAVRLSFCPFVATVNIHCMSATTSTLYQLQLFVCCYWHVLLWLLLAGVFFSPQQLCYLFNCHNYCIDTFIVFVSYMLMLPVDFLFFVSLYFLVF